MIEKRRPGRPATGRQPTRTVRMPEDRWQHLGDAAEVAGTDRAKVLNDFAAWYTHEPGAKLPGRPPAQPKEEH